MPQSTTSREIQLHYRAVFDRAKKSGPVIVMTRNQPDVVILSIEDFEQLSENLQPDKFQTARDNIKVCRRKHRNRILLGAALMSDL